MLTMDEYQRQAMRTASLPTLSNTKDQLLTASLGISGEGGEIADHVKKVLYHGHELDSTHLEKELGDVLWYCALLAHFLNTTLGAVAERNIAKLRARYPDGFDSSRSINRGNDV